jgi:alpha-ribazole phosphatase
VSEVVLVRHAPPIIGGLCAGRGEFEVEPAGPSADAVLRRLPSEAFERVISSPSSRCYELATELARRLRLPLSPDERLHELHFGAWEGRAWDDVAAQDGDRLARWMEYWQVEAPPGGERLRELEDRVRAFLHEVGHGLVVAHAGIIRAAWVISAGWPWPRAMSTPVGYLEPVRIRVER